MTSLQPQRNEGLMPKNDDLLAMSGAEMRRRIGSKEISPVELMEAAIARIERLNPAVNAICATTFARAHREAKAAEKAVLDGQELGSLHGLPAGVKDLHDAEGLLTTHGSPLYRDNVAAHDCAMVANVRKAGAFVVAKTNVPEFASARSHARSAASRASALPLCAICSGPATRWSSTSARPTAASTWSAPSPS
jgi:Asp-tRNA(Asn)/Glu-tRNA(Gln) amidotransferase A subunit family amidase